MNDRSPDVCPQCGAEIDGLELAGTCPKCLMRKGLETLEGSTLPVDPGVGPGDVAEAISEVPGRYTLIGEHARGGMGRVLVVHDESLGRDVALKELLPGVGDDPGSTPAAARHSKELAARFLREARVTGQLEHPGITPVHELGRRPDGSLYYTMKLVSGRTLDEAIAGARSYEERRRLLPHFVDLCQAIAYAHSRGVIHRDIKPSNVLIGEFGETVVIDWGLAKVIEGNGDAVAEVDPDAETVLLGSEPEAEAAVAETRYGDVMGTPVYMSPEQARGELDRIDERTDIYSLGAVLYQILTGRPPFEGKSAREIVAKASHERPPSVRTVDPAVSRELEVVCERAMAQQPGERTASAGRLARQVQEAARTPDLFLNPLRPYLSDLVPEVRQATRLEKAMVVSEADRRWRRKNRWPWVLQSLAILGALVLFWTLVVTLLVAVVEIAREIGFVAWGETLWDDVIWVAITVPGIVLPLVLSRRARNRSIAPYVREVLSGWDMVARSPSARGTRLAAAARKVAGTGFLGLLVGGYVSVLLMSDLSSTPSPGPFLLGGGAGLLVEAVLLWRSELRRGPAEPGVAG